MVERMGLQFVQASDAYYEFSAPFDACKNQLGVAFGGAGAAAMAVSSWVCLTAWVLEQTGRQPQPLLGEADQRFLRPCRSDLSVWVQRPAREEQEVWLARLQANERLRVHYTAQVLDDQGRVCAESRQRFSL